LNDAENSAQIHINRNSDLNGAPGSVYFRTGQLSTGLASFFGANEFKYKALTPAISWKPAPLQGMVENLALSGQTLSWTYSGNNVRYAIYAVPYAQADNDPKTFSSSRYLVDISYTTQFTIPASVSGSTHRFAVSVIDGFGNRYAPRTLGGNSATPMTTTLTYPANNAALGLSATFNWTATAGAVGYVWQLSRNADFTDLVVSRETVEPTFTGLPLSMKDDTRYYWRVRTLTLNGGDTWSEARSFTAKILAKVEDVAVSENADGNVIQRFPINITFSHRMNRTSVQQAISFEPAANVIFSWATDYTVRANISNLAYETDYTMTINGSVAKDAENDNLLDGAGNETEGSNFVFNFRTISQDSEPPVVVSFDPQGNQEISARPIVRIEFDKPLNASKLDNKIIIKDKNENPLAGVQSYQVTANFKSVMHFMFNEDLNPQETYTVTLLAGVEDTYGNAIPEDFVFTFTARPRGVTLVNVLDDFNTLASSWFQPGTSGSTIGINTTSTNVSRNTEVLATVESTGSVRMNYLWLATSATPVIRWHSTIENPKFSRDNTIQYYLFGDGSNSQVAVVLRSGGAGSTWGHQLVTLDWVGWRLITWNLATDPIGSNVPSTSTSASLPSGNVLNLSCFLVYPAPMAERLDEVSSIYFSQLRVVRLGGVSNPEIPAESGISIYTVNESIKVSASENIKTIKVYSLVGTLVKSVNPEQLSYQIPTNDLPQGVYIVEATTGTSQTNVKIVVR
jgi:hypothetical protein